MENRKAVRAAQEGETWRMAESGGDREVGDRRLPTSRSSPLTARGRRNVAEGRSRWRACSSARRGVLLMSLVQVCRAPVYLPHRRAKYAAAAAAAFIAHVTLPCIRAIAMWAQRRTKPCRRHRMSYAVNGISGEAHSHQEAHQYFYSSTAKNGYRAE